MINIRRKRCRRSEKAEFWRAYFSTGKLYLACIDFIILVTSSLKSWISICSISNQHNLILFWSWITMRLTLNVLNIIFSQPADGPYGAWHWRQSRRSEGCDQGIIRDFKPWALSTLWSRLILDIRSLEYIVHGCLLQDIPGDDQSGEGGDSGQDSVVDHSADGWPTPITVSP